MKEYNIQMNVRINSNLDKKQLNSELVLALWTEENGVTLDGDKDELRVIEYDEINILDIYKEEFNNLNLNIR